NAYDRSERMATRRRFFVRTAAVLIVVSFVSICGFSECNSSFHSVYGRSEIKQVIRTAHTSEQLEAVANYYGAKECEFQQKATEQQVELDRRIAMPYSSPKYPTPSDSARALLQYYHVKANEYGRRADAYRIRASEAASISSLGK